ncbi:MAG: cob(I)yrinic acid a,c-diamide adenosyltransferase [Candidatus Bathyarchaeota archaeon]|nr:cob(I)yrinic acid a,c-diamide adenosyltransferase [Candidatus Bathyarchaeota archaeon]
MGHIYLYYGTGGGKTITSLGLALRSLGHGHRVVIIQFLKHWKKTGEYRAAKILGPLYEIRQFGKPGWINSGDEEGEVSVRGFKASLRSPDEEDKAAALRGLRYARKVLKSDHPPDLLILDEVCLAAHMGIADTEEVLSLLDQLPDGTDVVLTGRYASRELIDRADFVNEVREVKAPAMFVSREGIQY